VKEGSFAGTVVQQPYEWGYQGSKLMANVLKGDKSGVPADGIIIIPGLAITTENVDQFQADLTAKLAKLN
jgi:ribose transport system substrate-binding protein